MISIPSARTWTALAWASLLVLLGNSVVTMEWSFPYCNRTNPHDGPAYAVYGFPLPYTQFSGTTSLVYEVMPLAWLFNATVIGGAGFWILRRALARVRSRAALIALALVGGVPAAGLALLEVVNFTQLSSVRLVLAPHYDGGYADLRPVGVGNVGEADCRASPFWFGPVARHAAQ